VVLQILLQNCLICYHWFSFGTLYHLCRILIYENKWWGDISLFYIIVLDTIPYQRLVLHRRRPMCSGIRNNFFLEFRMANILVFSMIENHTHKCKLVYKDVMFIPSFVHIRAMFNKLSKGTDTHGHYNVTRITLFIKHKGNLEETTVFLLLYRNCMNFTLRQFR
jgi:hypothetical protein